MDASQFRSEMLSAGFTDPQVDDYCAGAVSINDGGGFRSAPGQHYRMMAVTPGGDVYALYMETSPTGVTCKKIERHASAS